MKIDLLFFFARNPKKSFLAYFELILFFPKYERNQLLSCTTYSMVKHCQKYLSKFSAFLIIELLWICLWATCFVLVVMKDLNHMKKLWTLTENFGILSALCEYRRLDSWNVKNLHYASNISVYRCAQCFRAFQDGIFYEFEGRKYCERDFHVLFAPCCNKCGEFVIGRVIKAMAANWHPNCFRCEMCSKELADCGFIRNQVPNQSTLKTSILFSLTYPICLYLFLESCVMPWMQW